MFSCLFEWWYLFKSRYLYLSFDIYWHSLWNTYASTQFLDSILDLHLSL